jgi:hypothetical protein
MDFWRNEPNSAVANLGAVTLATAARLEASPPHGRHQVLSTNGRQPGILGLDAYERLRKEIWCG